MYKTKSRIYNTFDKTQKSNVCNFIRALVRCNPDLSCDELLDKFIEDERYYQELNSSRFPYLIDVLDDRLFIFETKQYIIACKKYYEYKETQRPIIEANKAFEKKKRKFLQEVKMSKEDATIKQIKYYKQLCKRYSIESKNVEEMSKLEMRDEIERILNEHGRDN